MIVQIRVNGDSEEGRRIVAEWLANHLRELRDKGLLIPREISRDEIGAILMVTDAIGLSVATRKDVMG
jgi:hypothetical protein